MIARTAAEIARAVAGRVVAGDPHQVAVALSIDSRRACEGDLFFAIRGERHDGHDFAAEAFRRGARVFVVDRELPGLEGAAIVRVGDTTRALGDLGRDERRRRRLLVVGITGSAGKTTTRALTVAALSARFKTAGSPGNLNNHWGVPLSILGLPHDIDAAVLELAMNHQGEIAQLTRIALPDLAVITNVGTAHLGHFDDVRGIARAKTELLREMPIASLGIVHKGSPELMIEAEASGRRLFRFDLDDPEAELTGLVIDSDLVEGTRVMVRGQEIHLRLFGRHAALNALAALAVAEHAGVTLREAGAKLAEVGPEAGRGAVHRGRGNTHIVDETYNANPSAMRAVLEAIAASKTPGRRVAVLGDMLELGAHAFSYHRKLGEDAARAGIRELHAVGEYAALVANAAAQAGVGVTKQWPDAQAAAEGIAKSTREGDLILVKGSRGVRLELVLAALLERFEAEGA